MLPKIPQVPQFPPSVVVNAYVQVEQDGMDVPTTVPVSDVAKPVRDAYTLTLDEKPLDKPEAVNVFPVREILPEVVVIV
jgi:hypothetical protein